MKNERKNKIKYHREGDYYIPNLVILKDEYPHYNIGKYGRLRLNYLKENKKADYNIMQMEGTLRKHIVETDIQAENNVKRIIKQLKEQSNLTEEMKDSDPLYWVGMMNNFKNIAEGAPRAYIQVA